MRPARLPKSAIPRTYRRIAPTHDWLAVLVEARARRLGLAWFGAQDSETLLEVAVGTGLSFQQLLRANPHGWTEGIDLTPAMLRKAHRRAERADTDRYRLRQGDAYALDFAADTFDGVLNSYMFDLLPVGDFVRVLREFKRVLKPGGRLVQMNMTLPEHWSQRGWEMLYRLHPALLGGCRGVQTAPFLREAGFVNVHRQFVSQWTFPSEVVYGEKPAAPHS
jgi:ubiquinone/menaquinone biosynthesis C-methylase UbiE